MAETAYEYICSVLSERRGTPAEQLSTASPFRVNARSPTVRCSACVTGLQGRRKYPPSGAHIIVSTGNPSEKTEEEGFPNYEFHVRNYRL